MIRLREALLVLPLLYFVLCSVLMERGHDYDMGCWTEWTRRLQRVGIAGAYENASPPWDGRIGYPPVWVYALGLAGKALPAGHALFRRIYLVKSIPLLFDFLICALAMWYAARRGANPMRGVYLILNPAFLWISLVWGQIDSILMFFVLGSLIAVLEKRPVLSAASFVFAINTKQQAILFLPFLFLLHLDLALATPKGKRALQGWTTLAAALAVQTVLLLPFIVHGNLTQFYEQIVINSVDRFPAVSVNAFNLWWLLIPRISRDLSDETVWAGLSLKAWGLALFSINYAALLAIALRSRVRPAFESCVAEGATPSAMEVGADPRGRLAGKDRIPTVFLAFGLGALALFFFPTQMHERYISYALVFFAMDAILTNRWWLYVCLSVVQLVHLEWFVRRVQLLDALVIRVPPRAVALAVLAVYLAAWYRWIRSLGPSQVATTEEPGAPDLA